MTDSHILGINFGIDSAAALLQNGEPVAAVMEERLNREKHSARFPIRAAQYCLQERGLSLDDISQVAFFWNPLLQLERLQPRISSSWRNHADYLYSLPNHLLDMSGTISDPSGIGHTFQSIEIPGRHAPLKLHYVSHHLAHSAGTFFPSPFDRAAILSLDGYGETCSVLISRGEGNQITPLTTISYPHSPGSLYAAITEYLGFHANSDEGKVMALAATGNASRFRDLFKNLVLLRDDDPFFELDLSYFSFYIPGRRRWSGKFESEAGAARQVGSPLEQRHRDIAAALQETYESLLLHLARVAARMTGYDSLCLAGGCALNSAANARVRDETPFERVFIMPAAGDAGTSLGAALYLYHCLELRPRVWTMTHDYLGPPPRDIESILVRTGFAFESSKDISNRAAQLIAAGNPVGWVQGRAEFGPRALGNRSILADPRSVETKKLLDEKIKLREPFRPYAPAVLSHQFTDWFEPNHPDPFMLTIHRVRDDKKNLIPAVIHTDGTARTQSVSGDTNPRFAELLEDYQSLTGIPILLNTSFNLPGEPMVCSVEDALRCFAVSGLRYLVIEDYLVKKQ